MKESSLTLYSAMPGLAPIHGMPAVLFLESASVEAGDVPAGDGGAPAAKNLRAAGSVSPAFLRSTRNGRDAPGGPPGG